MQFRSVRQRQSKIKRDWELKFTKFDHLFNIYIEGFMGEISKRGLVITNFGKSTIHIYLTLNICKKELNERVRN